MNPKETVGMKESVCRISSDTTFRQYGPASNPINRYHVTLGSLQTFINLPENNAKNMAIPKQIYKFAIILLI